MQLDDDARTIGHSGGTAGYIGFNLYIPTTHRYVSGYINVMGDPGVVLSPVLARLAEP